MVFACVDPAAVPGLTIGTALGNLNSPMLIVDVVFGSLLTLVAASLMQRIGPRLVALAVPVIVNGFGVATMLAVVLDLPFWASVVWVGAGETAVMSHCGCSPAAAGQAAPRGFRTDTIRRLTRHVRRCGGRGGPL